MNITRRHFIKLSGLTWGALGLNLLTPLNGRNQLWAGNAANDKKVIFIFQRGGNDGINTVIPRGDSDYNDVTRPTLYIAEQDAIATGNGFAQFHPGLQPMMEVYNNSAINGQDGPGNLAVLHRVGYSGQSRSHFDSQQYWENGRPGHSDLQEGVFYRHIARNYDLNTPEHSFVAAGLSSSQLVALKGKQPLPNFNSAGSFGFRGNEAYSARFLGRNPGSGGDADGHGILGLYSGSPDLTGKIYRPLVHGTGQLLGATMETLQNALSHGAYTPSNGAVYPPGSFGRKLEEAAMLMKRTPVKFLGLNIGGWDTHSGQGQLNGDHNRLLNYLAQGFQALHRDLQDQWDNLIILTMTEFGRTSRENGSRGTDHAESSVMFVAGGGVRGGVYHCDDTTWKQGDMFSRNDRYLSRKTDFRNVLGEVLVKHLGESTQGLDEVIPGYSQAAMDNPGDFAPLNFITG